MRACVRACAGVCDVQPLALLFSLRYNMITYIKKIYYLILVVCNAFIKKKLNVKTTPA